MGAGSEDGRERGGKERERFAVKKNYCLFQPMAFLFIGCGGKKYQFKTGNCPPNGNPDNHRSTSLRASLQRVCQGTDSFVSLFPESDFSPSASVATVIIAKVLLVMFLHARHRKVAKVDSCQSTAATTKKKKEKKKRKATLLG